jgi:hypothetical protein
MIFINVLVQLFTWGKTNMLAFIELKGSKEGWNSICYPLFIISSIFSKKNLSYVLRI